MKRIRIPKSSAKVYSFLILTALLALTLQGKIQAATTIVDDGTTTPTITGPSVGAFFGYDGSDYDAGNGFTNGAAPGQTFLTPGTASAYDLNSITVQESGGDGGGNPVGQPFILGIFSVSGTTLTSLGTETYTFASNPSAGDFLTLDTSALGLTLSANTEYAFSFNDGSGNGVYLGLVSSNSGDNTTGPDSYSNGMAISFDGPTAAGNTETINAPTDGNSTYDRSFEVGLSAAPEPSTWAMMIGGVLVLLALQRRRLQG